MMYETLTSAIEHDIAVITLNRPAVMNALNTQMRAEITDAVRQAGQSARVVVLTGAGRAFCDVLLVAGGHYATLLAQVGVNDHPGASA